MKIDVKNIQGAVVGSIDLDDQIWGADVNENLLWEVVRWQRAKRRAGTHSTRTVAEVHGTGKKPYRQKGTGNARQGTLVGHHHVGGGRAFGPKPRDYDYSIPKKVKKGALRSALSLRAKEQQLIVLDEFNPPVIVNKAGKEQLSKTVASALSALGVEKALLVYDQDGKMSRGTKNLAKSKWLAPEGLNVYDVLAHDTLIITAPSAKKVEEALRPKKD